MSPLAHMMPQSLEDRVLAGRAHNEDAVVVSCPAGKAVDLGKYGFYPLFPVSDDFCLS